MELCAYLLMNNGLIQVQTIKDIICVQHGDVEEAQHKEEGRRALLKQDYVHFYNALYIPLSCLMATCQGVGNLVKSLFLVSMSLNGLSQT